MDCWSVAPPRGVPDRSFERSPPVQPDPDPLVPLPAPFTPEGLCPLLPVPPFGALPLPVVFPLPALVSLPTLVPLVPLPELVPLPLPLVDPPWALAIAGIKSAPIKNPKNVRFMMIFLSSR